MESYISTLIESVVSESGTVAHKYEQCIKELRCIGWCLTGENDKSALFCLEGNPDEIFVKFIFEKDDDLWIMKPHTDDLTGLELELFGDYIDIRNDVDRLTCYM